MMTGASAGFKALCIVSLEYEEAPVPDFSLM